MYTMLTVRNYYHKLFVYVNDVTLHNCRLLWLCIVTSAEERNILTFVSLFDSNFTQSWHNMKHDEWVTPGLARDEAIRFWDQSWSGSESRINFFFSTFPTLKDRQYNTWLLKTLWVDVRDHFINPSKLVISTHLHPKRWIWGRLGYWNEMLDYNHFLRFTKWEIIWH